MNQKKLYSDLIVETTRILYREGWSWKALVNLSKKPKGFIFVWLDFNLQERFDYSRERLLRIMEK